MSAASEKDGKSRPVGQQPLERTQPLPAGSVPDEGIGLAETVDRAAAETKAFAVRKARDVRDAAEQGLEEALGFVRARPIASLLIGFGLGYALGLLGAGAVRRAVRPGPPKIHAREIRLREGPAGRAS
jgi:hypothetical protein